MTDRQTDRQTTLRKMCNNSRNRMRCKKRLPLQNERSRSTDLMSSLFLSGLRGSLVGLDVPVDALLSPCCDASCLSLAELIRVVAEPRQQLVVKLSPGCQPSLGVKALLVASCSLPVQLSVDALSTSIQCCLLCLVGVRCASLPTDLPRQGLTLPAPRTGSAESLDKSFPQPHGGDLRFLSSQPTPCSLLCEYRNSASRGVPVYTPPLVTADTRCTYLRIDVQAEWLVTYR